MAPLKWVVRVWVLVVCGGYYGNSKGDMEGTPTWDNTYQLKFHVSPICCMVNFGGLDHVWGEVNLCYLSWSEGVSCKTHPTYVGVSSFPSPY